MLRRHCARMLQLAALTLASGAGLADTSERIPARFVDGERSLQNLIEIPAIDGDHVVAVYCVAQILPGGGIRDNHCFADAGIDKRFRDAIGDAIRKAEATPAFIDGEARTVGIHYRVLFLLQDGDAIVGVYPNWGDDLERYGSGYAAPQRVPQHGGPGQCSFFSSELFLIARVPIDRDGRVSGDVSLSGDYGKRHRLCLSSLRHYFEESEFIPATHDGKPVDAIYVEAVGRYHHMQIE